MVPYSEKHGLDSLRLLPSDTYGGLSLLPSDTYGLNKNLPDRVGNNSEKAIFGGGVDEGRFRVNRKSKTADCSGYVDENFLTARERQTGLEI